MPKINISSKTNNGAALQPIKKYYLRGTNQASIKVTNAQTEQTLTETEMKAKIEATRTRNGEYSFIHNGNRYRIIKVKPGFWKMYDSKMQHIEDVTGLSDAKMKAINLY